jgi:metal-sulfur cluster biosynthetic enzyme
MASELPDETAVREALRQVIDPEVGINIQDLGLVYDVAIQPEQIEVQLTMTSPACPLSDLITNEARTAIRAITPESCRIAIRIVWTPIWGPELMSDEAKAKLGW